MVKKDSKIKKERQKSFEKKKAEMPTLQLKTEKEIAMDFAVKVYQRLDKIIKSVVLFGSQVKKEAVPGSDIDVFIVIDDVGIKWDQELIAWYREELEKIVKANPYNKALHVNTMKLSTWWEDLMRGDPALMNMIRYGEALIDFAGFFEPIKALVIMGKVKATPEAIYACLERAPIHLLRSKNMQLSSIEGLFWAMVDSSHAALIAAKINPPSPEHIAMYLKETFVDQDRLKMKYVVWFKELYDLHKGISHGKIHDIKGMNIDEWEERSEEFVNVMAKLVSELIQL